jgi:hypothetical protein
MPRCPWCLPALILAASVALLAALAAGPEARADPAPPAPPVAPAGLADLPAGHWESPDGQLCLTLYRHGGFRLAAVAAGLRNPARLTGRVVVVDRPRARPRERVLTLEVSAIVSKTLGRCRRAWVDRPVATVAVLGVDVEAQGPRARFRLRLRLLGADPDTADLEICSAPAAGAGPCRRLKRQRETHTFYRPRPAYGCQTDADCILVQAGEMCEPCRCLSTPALTRWQDEDREALRRAEAECPPPVEARCEPCPGLVARCQSRRCVAVPP